MTINTECIELYVDYFLVPTVQNQHIYIKHTADFIHKIENIKPLADCWLCSFDISQMFLQTVQLMKYYLQTE